MLNLVLCYLIFYVHCQLFPFSQQGFLLSYVQNTFTVSVILIYVTFYTLTCIYISIQEVF